MFLEKWYADVVDPNGVDVFYRANLKLGPAVIGYRGHLGSGGRANSAFVPGGVELPREVDGGIVWPASDSEDGQALRWADSRSREIELWRHDRQLLTWDPVVLNGAVSGLRQLPGSRGYVERLTLNFGPWRLGLQRLKWGRFCGQRHSLVWIEWEGRIAKQLALLDGQPIALHAVLRERIDAAGATLALRERRALVQEPMADGALRGLRLPRRLASLQFFRGLETKWIAAGVLDLGGEAKDVGHALFEEVVWS
jgi:hypothetical protein